MTLALEPYLTQSRRWPQSGRRILAQFDANSVVVYQAYRKDIADYAVVHQQFGGSFQLGRMSWIKPNFLWMMYRSGWASKPDQESVLAIRVSRDAFETILRQAVHSSFVAEVYKSYEDWKDAVALSDVRLQWDPDHDPAGAPMERRAIQLGLHGEVLRQYAQEWILEIEDISAFVREQQTHAIGGYENLMLPREEVFVPTNSAVAAHLGIDQR